MAIEIERKFLVQGTAWRALAARSQHLVQGYLLRAEAPAAACSVRVRIGGDAAWLSIKSALAGIERREYEYPVPRAEAQAMLDEFCDSVIEKTRHYVRHGGLTFEVDEFLGDNAGLVVAELELKTTTQAFDRPEWIGRDVSELARYYNQHLLTHPYSRWSARERAGD